MPFRQFRYIYEVMKCRSINQAAQNLFISPQALRAAIGSMEDKAGFKMFERSKQGVSLTPEGEAIEADITAIMEMGEHWKRIRNDLSQVDGMVRLVAATAICNTIIPDIMLKCRERYPGVQLWQYEARDDGLLAMMARRRMIGIVGAAPRDEVLDKYERFAEKNHYMVEHLREDAFYVYINSESPLADQGELSLDDLRQLTPVMYPGEDKRFLYRSILDHFSDNPPFYLMHQENIFQLVAEDPQLACVFPAVAGENDRYLREGRVCPMTVRDFPMPALSCMIHPLPRDLMGSEKAVMDLIREEMQDPQYREL